MKDLALWILGKLWAMPNSDQVQGDTVSNRQSYKTWVKDNDSSNSSSGMLRTLGVLYYAVVCANIRDITVEQSTLYKKGISL